MTTIRYFPSLEELARRAVELPVRARRRAVLGIAGAPGAGKSTFAAALARVIGPSSVLIGMDAFHLDDAILREKGLLDVKGAPETFDAAGLEHLLLRLRQQERVFAPEFDRARELSRAGAVEVTADHTLVIIEGNYLLQETPQWAPVGGLLDEVWWLQVDSRERVRRLIDRHRSFGRSRSEATEWVKRTDEANATRVLADARRAALTIQLAAGPVRSPATSDIHVSPTTTTHPTTRRTT
ncbi:phosphoribulokinase/uridine kinase family protein [Microbacterium sp. SLBN-154]|uniref:nucleoside/nucleotide kinase family protein n=1 Tax=Microbacterium sp. SLBN-154 TaxID=2768458 RepID=UPI00115091D2|nr:nucleoside/nucleotide kinase family protein [Microbacterium sp. SLBN-154]TQK17723.1 phosphoribulokinase/uridine kinase family protein [Microbacterium sp. SLBN-154]